jgi:ribosomal protein S6--L-glutamate ligase
MANRPPGIITTNDQFHENFHLLDSNSIVCCRLRLSTGEEHILVDLSERGVTLFPSATAQLASRSKVHQARIFAPYMVPDTRVVYDTNQLLKATSFYKRINSSDIIIKQDRKNSGLGIHHFRDIENVYNMATFGDLSYPFVIQPFIDSFQDVRVIVLGDYIEAYTRTNRNNFRQNIHCGGESTATVPRQEVRDFCKDVMTRGAFPYGHIDLMITPQKKIYLIEINLRGGLRGATINSVEYNRRITAIHKSFQDSIQKNKKE